MPTKIEWCDETFNPIIGCSKCSPGCDNCYAEKFAARLAKNARIGLRALDYQIVTEGGRWSSKTVFDFSCFHKNPGKAKNIFLCSMGDLFHETVPAPIIYTIFDYMSAWPAHRFLVLTKRVERMRLLVRSLVSRWNGGVLGPVVDGPSWPLQNVWLGVTVCNQQEADEKIPLLIDTPAIGRFVSVEPMLEPVDLSLYMSDSPFQCRYCGHREWNCACECPQCGYVDKSGNGYCPTCEAGFPNNVICVCTECGEETRSPSIGVDWVIVGGETGPNARPMHPDWVRSVRDQCKDSGTPFFFKGWGEHLPLIRRENMVEGLRPFDYLPEGFDPDKWGHFRNYVFVNEDGSVSMSNSTNVREGYWLLKCGKKLSGRQLPTGHEYNERPW